MRPKRYSARRTSFLGARIATVMVLSLFLVIGLGRAADIKQGEELFKEHCAACHTVIESVRDKSGPNLNGVVGRNAGTENYGHGYTEEMMASGVTWLLLLMWWWWFGVVLVVVLVFVCVLGVFGVVGIAVVLDVVFVVGLFVVVFVVVFLVVVAVVVVCGRCCWWICCVCC